VLVEASEPWRVCGEGGRERMTSGSGAKATMAHT
jgi:hypothetical protein